MKILTRLLISLAGLLAAANPARANAEAPALPPDENIDPKYTFDTTPDFFSSLHLSMRRRPDGKWICNNHDFECSTKPQDDPDVAVLLMWRYIYKNGGVMQMILDGKSDKATS